MKNIRIKILNILVIFLMLVSCSSIEHGAGTPPPELQIFLKKAITNPEKLYNLRKYFPQYIHDKIFNARIYDTNNIKQFIYVLENKVDKRRAYQYFGFSSGIDNPYLLNRYPGEHVSTMNGSEVFSMCLSKLYRYSLEFFWVRIDSSYYLYDITSASGNWQEGD